MYRHHFLLSPSMTHTPTTTRIMPNSVPMSITPFIKEDVNDAGQKKKRACEISQTLIFYGLLTIVKDAQAFEPGIIWEIASMFLAESPALRRFFVPKTMRWIMASHLSIAMIAAWLSRLRLPTRSMRSLLRSSNPALYQGPNNSRLHTKCLLIICIEFYLIKESVIFATKKEEGL